MAEQIGTRQEKWLNGTTAGIGLASLFSDWCHEMATAVLPAFLASIGAGPEWLGLIEGLADGLSGGVKLGAGHYTDRLRRRKPLAVFGYAVTTLATAAMALATRAVHILAARATAWLGRGVRTPAKKTLLAAGVQPSAYGRAFGFERLMDTTGAIAGPLTALWLLHQSPGRFQRVFLFTLIPGALAVLCFGLLVRERARKTSQPVSFAQGLRGLPPPFRHFLMAVGIFGAGDFSHTLLILYATEALAPRLGAAGAASIAITLYVIHNVFYAGFAYLAGWMGDRYKRCKLLAGSYVLAALTALLLAAGMHQLIVLGVVFILGGIYVGAEETLEDSLAAELASSAQHGMAFGTLAGVNAVGDFFSSFVVGLLWNQVSASWAFGFAGFLFLCGALLVLRLR